MSDKEFTKDMTVGEAYSTHPMAKQMFAYFHIGGCHHCAVDESITIEDACEQYGVPLEMLLDQLNGLPEQGPGASDGQAPAEDAQESPAATTGEAGGARAEG